jgi:DNA-directed RNA polymerase specialized sigma24 family protein
LTKSQPATKADWIFTPDAFRHLLEWLDGGVDSGGEKYLEMRRRLVSYFDRKRRAAPDELADETLSRVARRLAEVGTIEGVGPAHYCYIVAKFVFLESLRHAEHVPASDQLPAAEAETDAGREAVLACLDRCLAALPADERELILDYYLEDRRPKIDRRRAYAKRLGVTPNALAIRACRIRARLERCMSVCARPSRHDFGKSA